MADGKSVSGFDSEWEVVIVGAGNGGLGAGLQLAASGVKPLILERHNLPGGFATSFVRGRFEFEISLHELSGIGPPDNRGNVREFLEDVGGVHLDWLEVPEAYRLISKREGIDVVMPFGLEAFVNAIEKEAPGSKKALLQYIGLCKEVSDALAFVAKAEGRPDKKYLYKNYPALLKTAPYTVSEVTNQFRLPERAKMILHGYWCYLGIPMERLSFTIWAAMLTRYLDFGAFIPRRRSQELSSAMASRILEMGGRIDYNVKVEKILVDGGRVVGVETVPGERIRTNRVLSNASPTLTYNRLIHPKEAAPAQAFQTVNARSEGLSGFVVYLGLNAPPEEIGLSEYGYFVCECSDIQEVYASTDRLDVAKMQAAVCLNNVVPDCSPPGTSILSMTTLYTANAWKDVKQEEYFKIKNRIADGMIRQFEEGTKTEIRSRVEEIEAATPVTFARYTGSIHGNIYGYEPDPWDSIIPRASALEDESFIEGLGFVGGFSFMCHGFSSSILSGGRAAKIMLKKMEAAQ